MIDIAIILDKRALQHVSLSEHLRLKLSRLHMIALRNFHFMELWYQATSKFLQKEKEKQWKKNDSWQLQDSAIIFS